MTTRKFHLNSEPHVADIGGTKLFFQPEVLGAEFASAYSELNGIQKKLKAAQPSKASSTKHAKQDEDIDASILGEVSAAMRSFVVTFLMPESVPVFEEMRLPDRVLTELLEWLPELYGGGSGNQDADGGTSAS